jgi:GT2 family glycosyltransferase
MTHQTIAAVVVTFNRADLLDDVIRHIDAQTRVPDVLIVIDNNSTDHTASVVQKHIDLRRMRIDYMALDANIGGAGGFYTGMKKAYEDGYDLIWLMDDDTMPEVDALLHLEQDLNSFEGATSYLPAFICSTVLWKNDDLCEMNIPTPVWDWPRFLYGQQQVALVDTCSFVSVLIRREKIKACGYPIKEFFIWYDDAEYTMRLSKNAYPGLLSMRSKVHHYLGENKGVNFALINKANAWKYRYGIRNQAAAVLRDHGWLRYLWFGFSRLRQVFGTKVERSVKWSMMTSFFAAIRFPMNVDYPD